MSERNAKPVEPDGKLPLWTVVDRVFKVASVLVFPLVAWGINTEIRLQKLPDQTELQIKRYVDDNVPPEWFRETVMEMKTDAKEDRKLLASLNTQVSNLTLQVNGLTQRVDTLLRNP